MERLMAAQATTREQDSMMNNFFKTAKKVLEINPRHPLIEGLLERVEMGDSENDEQLRDTVWTLWDTALVRSSFQLRDTDRYASFRISTGEAHIVTATSYELKDF